MSNRRTKANAAAGSVLAIDARAMQAHAGDAARLLKALANEHRLLVLCQLVQGERSVGEINSRIALSQSALSQHLAVLREDGLASTRRDGQTIYYALAPGPAGVAHAARGVWCARHPR